MHLPLTDIFRAIHCLPGSLFIKATEFLPNDIAKVQSACALDLSHESLANWATCAWSLFLPSLSHSFAHDPDKLSRSFAVRPTQQTVVSRKDDQQDTLEPKFRTTKTCRNWIKSFANKAIHSLPPTWTTPILYISTTTAAAIIAFCNTQGPGSYRPIIPHWLRRKHLPRLPVNNAMCSGTFSAD